MRKLLVVFMAVGVLSLFAIAAFAGQPPTLDPASKNAAPPAGDPPAAEPPTLPDPEPPAKTKKIDGPPLNSTDPPAMRKVDGPIEPSSRATPPSNSPPTVRPSATAAQSAAIIKVKVPATATIWIEDQRMTQGGAQRAFVSPLLEHGKTFVYTMKLTWPVGNGQADFVTQHEVTVHAGETTEIDFMPLTGIVGAQPTASPPPAQYNRAVQPVRYSDGSRR
jgi:uncharacterized protein (TIGR03000 family)